MTQRSEDLKTPLARLSYPNLFKKRKMDDGNEKYECVLIFDKGSDLSKLRQAVIDVVKAEWGDKAVDDLKTKKIKSPFRDGGEGSKADAPGYGPGTIYFTASSQTRQPLCVTRRMEPATEADLYGGCYVYAAVNAYTWSNPKQGRGVSFGILGVQFAKDGERLGSGGFDPSKTFEAIVDDESDAGGEQPQSAADMFG